MNLRCLQCQAVFREFYAIDDEYCPECHGTQLWETAAQTDDQLADEQFAAEAEESSAELEAIARRRIEARGIAAELVDVLRDVMGGAR
jgi:predicted  nucleic acid-binding Zn-ribbon protein